MSHPLYLVLGALAASAAGVHAWAHFAPRSFWFLLAFPVKAARVYLTWTLDAVPVASSITRASLQRNPR